MKFGDWSKEETEILREMYHAGTTIDAVSKRLGRSYNAVKEKAALMRRTEVLPFAKRRERPDSYSKSDEATIVRMYQAGASTRDIANKLGRAPSSIGGKIVRMRDAGVDFGARKKTKDGRTMNALVKKYGIRFGTLSEHLSSPDSTLSTDAIEWICAQALNGGYGSIAEFLVDCAMENYFEEIENA
jgi:transposase